MKTTLSLLMACLIGSSTLAQQPGMEDLPPGILEKIKQMTGKKGPKFYKVLPSQSSFGVAWPGAPINVTPGIRDAFQHGTALCAIEVQWGTDICPSPDKEVPDFTIFVLELDTSDGLNQFSTNQGNTTASFRISGKMKKWKPAPSFCEDEAIVYAGEGPGGMNASFNTTQHYTSRNFQVWTGLQDMDQSTRDILETQKFITENMIGYFQWQAEEFRTPRITGVIGNSYPGLEVGGNKVPPAGATGESSNAEGRYEPWMAIRDGLVAFKTAVDVTSAAKGFGECMTSSKARWQKIADEGMGLSRQLFAEAGTMTAEQVQESTGMCTEMYSELAQAAFNPMGWAENRIYGCVNDMVAGMAEINKKYAAQGDRGAQARQKFATVPLDDPRQYTTAIDGDYMAHQLMELTDAMDELEHEFGKLPKAASGQIWGPGLWNNLKAWNPGVPAASIAASACMSESKQNADPEVLAALKALGYPVPDQIPDVDAVLENLPELPEGVEFDVNQPQFNGNLVGTNFATIQGRKVPKLYIWFSISSPDDTLNESWRYQTSVWDLLADEEPEPEQPQPEQPEAYFVGTNGSDSNPGTNEAPFATLRKAINTAQVDRLAGKQATIIVKDGVYRESSSITFPSAVTMPKLTIKGESRHGAIFVATEPVEGDSSWTTDSDSLIWQATLPLHPDQGTWPPSSTAMISGGPVLAVDGERLIFLPLADPHTAGIWTYSTTDAKFYAPAGAKNVNERDVQVSIRPYALELNGAMNITINDLLLRHYPMKPGEQSPGIIHSGGVTVAGCKFE